MASVKSSTSQPKAAGTRVATKRSSTGPGGLAKSHKSYQSVQPCGNKLLQRKWDQTYYDEHRRLVKTAKPMVDTKSPQVRPHVTSKLKKQQIQKERSDVVDRDNIGLLKKMQRIMDTEGQVDHKYTYKHHSLNQKQRQDELDRISTENKQMLKRLEKVEPMYKVTDWIDDWRRKEELTGMITAFPDSTKLDSSTGSERSKKSSKDHTNSSVTSQNLTEEETTYTSDSLEPQN